jgi:hypothetical protein
MDLKSVLPRPRKALTKEQKAAFVLLMFLGIGGTLLGFLSFGASIKRPFEIQLARYAGPQYLTPDQRQSKEMEESKSRDTDGDGLSDYDEIYVFKTSPYLADTDSDGFDDKTEIFSGNDPNCPQGKDCGRVIATLEQSSDTNADAGGLLGPIGSPISAENMATMNFSSAEDVQNFLESLSVDQIRQSLIEFGVDEKTVNSIDDETLRSYFEEAVTQAQESGQISDLAEASQQAQEEASGSDETTTTP